MRQCVFLAVLLSLVLSLSKGSDNNTPPETTTPVVPGSKTTTLSETPTPVAPGSENTTLSETPTPTASGSNNNTPTETAKTTAPGSKTTTLSETPTPVAPGSQNTTLSETPTQTAPGSDNNTPTETTTPVVPGSKTTTLSETPTPVAPGSENTTLSETPTPIASGSNSNTPTETAKTTAPGSKTTTLSETPTPVAPGSQNTTLSETPTQTAPGSENTTLSETPTPIASGSDDNTPTETTTPVVPGSKTTTLSETPTPVAPGSENTTLSETPTPTASGSDINTPTETTKTTAPGYDASSPSEKPTPPSPGNDTATPSGTPTALAPGDFCSQDPCGKKMARCVALHSNYICQCPYGFYYSNEDCNLGKIFPGFVILNVTYSDSVQVVNSTEYEEVFQNITIFFKEAFSESAGFEQTVIVKIEPLQEDRASLTTAAAKMNVTVTNLFTANSAEDNETISSAIKRVIGTLSYISEYEEATYCAAFNCDTQTTDCKESVFPTCTCKSNFSRTEWDDRSCSDCRKDCSVNENKYCEKENGVPTCKCMSNFEMKNGKCVACPVGYAGENCKNNSELILIIVGTVFGAIILSLLIAISVISVRAKNKQDPERKSLIKSGYSNPNTSDGRQIMMFPRVQTTSGHANPGYQPNNPYEVHSTNRGRFQEQGDEDLYGISREPEGFRLQNRY